MKLGYRGPLYMLPFDHRQSYVADMFHLKQPLTEQQASTVRDSKQLIYDGFRQSLDGAVRASNTGILVDEQYGTAILHDAVKRGYATALSVEKSGVDEFQFEYGDAFGAHIAAFQPTFAKVLVRYNPDGDEALNQRQTKRLKLLSDHCRAGNQRFMFELLVPATTAQMGRVGANVQQYDQYLRPALMRKAIRALQSAGIEPDVWKIEGMDTQEDCEQLLEVVRREGREEVSCIVLGRGADEQRVMEWLQIAASVAGFIGFAVGRTTFWDAVADYESRAITREEASKRIAQRFHTWVAIFEKARAARINAMHEDIKVKISAIKS